MQLWMAVLCMFEWDIKYLVTLSVPPAGPNFQTALPISAPRSLLTTFSLLLVAIIVVPQPTSCSASLGRAGVEDGQRNSHLCQQNDGDQLHCALEQL